MWKFVMQNIWIFDHDFVSVAKAKTIQLWQDVTGQPAHKVLEGPKLFYHASYDLVRCAARMFFLYEQGWLLTSPAHELDMPFLGFCRCMRVSKAK